MPVVADEMPHGFVSELERRLLQSREGRSNEFWRAVIRLRVQRSVESRVIARFVFDLADLALLDFVPLSRAFTSPYPPEDLDAERGLRKVQRLRARVADGAVTTDPSLRQDLLDDLDRCVACLGHAAEAGVPFRISRRPL